MKTIGWVAWTVSMVTIAAVATTADAGDDKFVERTGLKYTWGGEAKEYDSAEAACKAGVAKLKTQGNKQEYIRVKEGPGDNRMTCVLKNLNGTVHEVWNQELVEKIVQCPATTQVRSFDNSGTFKSQKCKCDPDKGCPAGTGSGSGSVIPPPQKCRVSADHAVCKKKRRPTLSELDRSDRCKQQPEPHPARTAKEATKLSEANQKTMQSNGTGREITKRYNDALKDIRDDLVDEKQINTGRHRNFNVFPKFGPKDMCETGGRPTDVNIGMLCGTRGADFAAANSVAGYGTTPIPELCVWHHHQDLGRMQLVKRTSHDLAQGGVKHTGGVAVWQKALAIPDYPACCP